MWAMRKRSGRNNIRLSVAIPSTGGRNAMSLSEVREATIVGTEGVDTLSHASWPIKVYEAFGRTDSTRASHATEKVTRILGQLVTGNSTEVDSGGTLVRVSEIFAHVGWTNDGSTRTLLRNIAKIGAGATDGTFREVGVKRTIVGGSSAVLRFVASSSIGANDDRSTKERGRLLLVGGTETLSSDTKFRFVARTSSRSTDLSGEGYLHTLPVGALSLGTFLVQRFTISVGRTLGRITNGARRKIDISLANAGFGIARTSGATTTFDSVRARLITNEIAIVKLNLKQGKIRDSPEKKEGILTVIEVAVAGTVKVKVLASSHLFLLKSLIPLQESRTQPVVRQQNHEMVPDLQRVVEMVTRYLPSDVRVLPVQVAQEAQLLQVSWLTSPATRRTKRARRERRVDMWLL